MATINAHEVPYKVTITNISSDQVKVLQFYRVNTRVRLQPADVLTLLVDTSAELLYWQAQVSTEISVAAEAIVEAV